MSKFVYGLEITAVLLEMTRISDELRIRCQASWKRWAEGASSDVRLYKWRSVGGSWKAVVRRSERQESERFSCQLVLFLVLHLSRLSRSRGCLTITFYTTATPCMTFLDIYPTISDLKCGEQNREHGTREGFWSHAQQWKWERWSLQLNIQFEVGF